MHLTARGYHRVLRVARTLADLDGAEKIGRLHLAEALSYRALAEDQRARRNRARCPSTLTRRANHLRVFAHRESSLVSENIPLSPSGKSVV